MFDKYLFFLTLLFGPSNREAMQNVQLNALDIQSILDNAGDSKAEVNQYLEIMHGECLKHADEGAYQAVENGLENMVKCTSSIIQKSIERKGIKTTQGFIDMFCLQAPLLANCFKRFINELNRCMPRNSGLPIDKVHNSIEQIVEAVCKDKGKSIAKFIAVGGLDCLTNKTEEIEQCYHIIMKPSDTTSYQDISSQTSQTFTKKECKKMRKLKKCIVEEMRSCRSRRPAIMFNSFSKMALQTTSCPKYKVNRHPPNLSNEHHKSSVREL